MTIEAFDLCDLVDDVAPPGSEEKPVASETDDMAEWAAGIVEKAVQRESAAGPVFYDIETGPRPWEEIEAFYEPLVYQEPLPLPPWNESMVKYGNAKKEDKRKEVRDRYFAEYQVLLADESNSRAAHKSEWEAKEAAHKAEWSSKAALSPVTGRVLLIGVIDGAVSSSNPLSIFNDDESVMLDRFWAWVDEWLAAKRPIIGHASNGFDLPYLVRRSWCLGVPVPREVRQGRYWNPLFRDTMEFWNCGARDYVKLNTLGEFFGVGQKTEGVKGGDFSKLWYGQMPAETWGTPDEQRLKALEYNGQDLRLTAPIAAKMGMV